MRQINKITDDAVQQFNLIGDAGQNISFLLYWVPTQEAWFCDIEYNTFIVNGVQLTVSPNLLRNYRNLINFGIGMASVDGYESLSIEDFITGRLTLYLLSQEEVQQIETLLFT